MSDTHDSNWQQLVDELNAFELDSDYPVTKAQKRKAKEKKQAERSERLVRLAKGGAHVPPEELRRRNSIRFIG